MNHEGKQYLVSTDLYESGSLGQVMLARCLSLTQSLWCDNSRSSRGEPIIHVAQLEETSELNTRTRKHAIATEVRVNLHYHSGLLGYHSVFLNHGRSGARNADRAQSRVDAGSVMNLYVYK